MNLHIILRTNRDGNAVHHLIFVVHLHRADLNHLEHEPIPDLPEYRAVKRHRLIPLKVYHDIMQWSQSPQYFYIASISSSPAL